METLKLGSSGSNVMEIQSLLKKIGYNSGSIDGKFGEQTKLAVKEFQKNNYLEADGIIGPKTYAKLNPLLIGYDTYTIQPKDTLWEIAIKYYTTVNKILVANPSLNPYSLKIGQKIIVPFGIDIVDTDIGYNYEIMERDIQGLKTRYPFIEVGIAGKSVLGKNLYYIRLGKGTNKVFYNGSHHATEWITTPLLMKFIENFLKSFTNGKNIRGYNLEDIWNGSSIYIIPMVNPDGVDLVINGLSPSNPYYEELISWNTSGLPFSKVWKSNIKGVDLNRNYNALWYEYKELSEELGYDKPGPYRYPGTSPESEPESKAIADFTRKYNFNLTLAYHTQGEVIFWDFLNLAPPSSKPIGEMFAKASGYTLFEPTEITASYAGYKDWYIQEYIRPGYTIEVGKGVSPVPLNQFPTIYDQNEEILLLASMV